ncbi:MAG: TonB-dependent receptor [Burkholderiales bacterium]|nr:TonB-dependent receptor [Bacteroidia bacterium]
MKTVKQYSSGKILSSTKYGNSFMFEQDQQLQKRKIKKLQWFFVAVLILGYVAATLAQTGMKDIELKATSEFEPTIKDAVKLGDLPEIKDTVKKIEHINYGIASTPLISKYEVIPIDAAKMKNEPLSKLYRSLLKIGMGNYTTPYGEFWLNSLRTRDVAYGVHLKHLSSSSHLRDVGYSGFSDNEAEIFGKKFYKKHTLTGEFNYKRNMMHFYGYDTTENKLTKDYTKQRYQLFEPVIKVQSHFTDSSKLNHFIKLGYYNLTDLYHVSENSVSLNTVFNTFINKERLFVAFDADYYSHKLPNDTFNDVILKLNPYFETHGKKWTADIGLAATLDMFSNSSAKFYFYPQLNAQYDVYESIIIPYVGVNGGLQKNSLRSLSNENPFITSTINYRNTNTKFNVFGGLKGNLSSKTSYDAKASYSIVDSMHFFVVDYTANGTLDNQYKVLYDNTDLFNVTGQLKYQYKEKMNFIAKGNYYMYKTKNLERAYHKPQFDLTFSAVYNLKSKIIIKGDIFVIGNQFALTKVVDNDYNYSYAPKLLKGIVDINLGAEYRYSKMLSFFVNFNNIANTRYYRWEKYPSQRFNFMAGLTFIPF